MNNFSSSIIKTIDGTVTVTLSNGAIYSLENCSDELYNNIVKCRFDYDKLERLLNPKLDENRKEVEDFNNLIDKVNNSNYITKLGDCFYIKSISNISVPIELVKSFLEAEINNSQELIESYLNFWRLCSMNPNSEARANLFWFLKKWGMKISKNGFIVAFRNAVVKHKNIHYELAEFISESFLNIRFTKKKSTKDYVIVKDNEDNYFLFKNTSKELENKKFKVLGTVQELYNKLSNENEEELVFTDQHSGTTTIKLGQPVRLNRKECDESQISCSRGLHAGGLHWLGQGYFGDVTLMVLINPSQIVSVPKEDDYGKLRCCEYYPVSIVSRDGKGNIIIPDFEDSFDDDFLNITLENYGINNNDIEKQTINIPKLIELEERDIIRNLEYMKDKIKSKIIK
jgi:hypothetical protein